MKFILAPLAVAASRLAHLGGTVATIGFPDIGLQGLLNKETRLAGVKPVHGFMDFLLNPKQFIQSSWPRRSWI